MIHRLLLLLLALLVHLAEEMDCCCGLQLRFLINIHRNQFQFHPKNLSILLKNSHLFTISAQLNIVLQILRSGHSIQGSEINNKQFLSRHTLTVDEKLSDFTLQYWGIKYWCQNILILAVSNITVCNYSINILEPWFVIDKVITSSFAKV